MRLQSNSSCFDVDGSRPSELEKRPTTKTIPTKLFFSLRSSFCVLEASTLFWAAQSEEEAKRIFKKVSIDFLTHFNFKRPQLEITTSNEFNDFFFSLKIASLLTRFIMT